MPKTKSVHFKTILKKISLSLQKIPAQLSLLLLLLTILRLPNFFEPYWYGDEAIYLTIGQSLNDGAILYQDIIDHKTPIIYYLARTDTQFNFRILLYFWMLITTSAWYFLAKKIWRSEWGAFVGGLIFVLLTTLPWFEGHIPNGELFVMGFVLVGMWLLWQSNFISRFIEHKTKNNNKQTSYAEAALLIGAGSSFSLGLLTKVPALFDFVAALGIAWFTITNNLNWALSQTKKWWHLFWQTVIASSWLTLGFAIPILISVFYFLMIGAGQAYLQYGLLYNFHYAGNWDLNLTQTWLSYWFTIPGKLTFLVLLLAILTLVKNYISRQMQWLLMWFGLALVASLLSNRPYPHYFLQLVPPLTLLAAGFVAALTATKKSWPTIIGRLLIGASVFGLCSGLMFLMDVSLYPSKTYYENTYKYVTNQMSQADYYQSFNTLMLDNYQAAKLIKDEPGDKMFIWGTNPMLYALSERHPVGRFTVAFHIHDLDAYSETISALKNSQPQIIVIMEDETIALPGLNRLLSNQYELVAVFDHFTVWQFNGID